MQTILNSIEDLSNQIEESKKLLAKYEGAEEELLKQLKENFNLSSLEEAEKEVFTLGKELTKLEKEIKKDYDFLRTEYEW